MVILVLFAQYFYSVCIQRFRMHGQILAFYPKATLLRTTDCETIVKLHKSIIAKFSVEFISPRYINGLHQVQQSRLKCMA